MSFIMLDAGGTNIKSCVMDASGLLEGGISECPSLSGEDEGTIFSNLASVIAREAGKCASCEGIGFAFPGPFDYDAGVSLMRGIGKYDSIYGLSIRERLNDYLPQPLRALPMLFAHDVMAFAEGVAAMPQFRRGRMIALVIGTGAGSAFVEDGRCLKGGRDGIPENGWIYNQAFRASIIDDYISARGQDRLAVKHFGKAVSGRRLDELAAAGDGRALAVFNEFGSALAEAVMPYIISFHPDTIVLAGQIARSARFFISPLAEAAGERVSIHVEPETSLRIFQGLLAAFGGKG